MTTAAATIKVLLVDDSTLVRQGVRSVITSESEGSIEVVGEAESIRSGMRAIRELKPDVVLLDIRLPDGSGLDACRKILSEHPSCRVLILTSFTNDNLVYDAVIAGAQGYLMKEIDPTGLIKAITDAAAGKSVLTNDVTSRVLRMIRNKDGNSTPNELSSLSNQEGRVLALVAEGLTNKEVGERLKLSENTVKNYLVSVFEKLNVKRRSQAAALYVSATQKNDRLE
jgi:two-component system response regulator DevR